MSKSGRRTRRRPSDNAVQRSTGNERPLLDRILETPHLAHVIPRLSPEVLHHVIQSCGLEECGEIVALATPEQLRHVFDLDLWRADKPGLDEHFDADRFGVWLEVLMESGADIAAKKLAEMDTDLVVTALAQHIRVLDRAAILLSTPDGEEVEMIQMGDEPSLDIAGYRIVATRSTSWNAIVDVLVSLDAENHQSFHRVMRGCVSLSNSTPEIDGLDELFTDRDQTMFDLELSREGRRETQGYVTPAQARAFLQMARQYQPRNETTPPANPLSRAYFRGLKWTPPPDSDSTSQPLPAEATAAFVDMLLEAGVLPQQPRALLESGQGDASRLARLRPLMQFVYERDHSAYSIRSQELGYLANTLVAGCSIQARPFTPRQASEAVAAVCNLGIENLQSGPAEDFLIDHDLINVFQIGSTVLHERVCMYTADRLVETLSSMRFEDREIQAELDVLRLEMRRHLQTGEPWRARNHLEVIAILDMPAWATLLALLSEFPVMHAALAASRDARVHAVSPTDFEFISENSHIALVRAFVQKLPETLHGWGLCT